jgi:hypothetical protein
MAPILARWARATRRVLRSRRLFDTFPHVFGRQYVE